MSALLDDFEQLVSCAHARPRPEKIEDGLNIWKDVLGEFAVPEPDIDAVAEIVATYWPEILAAAVTQSCCVPHGVDNAVGTVLSLAYCLGYMQRRAEERGER